MRKTKSIQLVILLCTLLFIFESCEKSAPSEANEQLVTTAAKAKTGILKNEDPGFEHHGLDKWDVFEPNSIAQKAIVRVDENGKSRFHDKHLFMRLPAIATDNQKQYISVGQYLPLSCKKKYRFSVHVKWANPNNGLPSAIISLWARNPDGTYNGKDEWIYDGNNYKYLNFEFTPNETGSVFCYIALLTHQKGFKNTDILVDALRIEEIGDAEFEEDPRAFNQNLLKNSDFENNFASWQNTQSNPNNVGGLNKDIVSINDDKKMRLILPSAPSNTYLNNTWTGVFQKVTLYAGNTYELSANVNRIEPDRRQYETIVNLYTYKPKTTISDESWLGSVDYKFNKRGSHPYSKTIRPNETTTYHITARVFGWGNEGRPVAVDLDDIEIKRTANCE